MKNLIYQREFLLIVILVVMCIAIGNVNEGFWTVANFKGLARSFALDSVVLIGMTFLLISGMFDISVASVMALSGFVFASLFINGIPILFAALITLAIAGVIGYFNGFVITKFKVNPFITTLSTQTIVRGTVLALSQGRPIRATAAAFTIFSTSEIFGIPTVFIVTVAVLICVDLALRNIRYFRQLYFIGGNEMSAELIGIDVNKTRVIFYITAAMLAAVSGMLSASRLGGASPIAYAGKELILLAAAVIGGCSLNGGQGTMFGSALGLMFLFLLNNGLIMLRVDIFWFNFAVGFFLIVVVLINTLSGEAAAKRQKLDIALGR
jgi:ribose transport system permease protein